MEHRQCQSLCLSPSDAHSVCRRLRIAWTCQVGSQIQLFITFCFHCLLISSRIFKILWVLSRVGGIYDVYIFFFFKRCALATMKLKYSFDCGLFRFLDLRFPPFILNHLHSSFKIQETFLVFCSHFLRPRFGRDFLGHHHHHYSGKLCVSFCSFCSVYLRGALDRQELPTSIDKVQVEEVARPEGSGPAPAFDSDGLPWHQRPEWWCGRTNVHIQQKRVVNSAMGAISKIK